MDARRCEVAGVRVDGFVAAYVETHDLSGGQCGDCSHPILKSQVVSDALPLTRLIQRLNTCPLLFVQSLGQVGGTVTRTDLVQPPARMWLFGMITLIELRFGRMIEAHCPNESWKASLSDGRIQKATVLLDERLGRNRQARLADCLQFSDKAQIIARNGQLRSRTRFQSRRQIEEMASRLESLRNNLAHSQDIVTQDWGTIVLLTENLASVLDGPPA